jgi:hypothetical protein
MRIKLFPQNNRLSDNGYSREEEGELYLRQLQDVIDNPRWYLDNLHKMQEYRLSWVDYKKMDHSLPLEYVKEKNLS